MTDTSPSPSSRSSSSASPLSLSSFPASERLRAQQEAGRIGALRSSAAIAVFTQILNDSPLLIQEPCPHGPSAHRDGGPSPIGRCTHLNPILITQLSPVHELNRAVATHVFRCTLDIIRHDYGSHSFNPYHCRCEGSRGSLTPASALASSSSSSSSSFPRPTGDQGDSGVPLDPSFEHTADHGPRYLAPYCSDMLWAWKVVTRLAQRGRTHGFFWSLRRILDVEDDYLCEDLGYIMLEQDALTLATAICLAAVHAIDNPSVLDTRDDGASLDTRSIIQRSIDGGLGSDYPPQYLDYNDANHARALSHRLPPYDVVCMHCGSVAFLTDTPPLLQADIQNAYRLSLSPPSPLENSVVPYRTDLFDRAHIAHANPIPNLFCPGCHGWITDVRSAAGGWQAHIAPPPSHAESSPL